MISHNPQPFNNGYLPEKDGHKIWFAQYGNPSGPAIVVCHGGPGSKSKPKYTNPFDLSKYQVILFDQRGCGKSLPQGEISHNTTPDLVADMERLRTTLNLEKWFVAGGSWGSTLSLVYTETHPSRVLGLLLSSIFLGRRQDVDWSFTKEDGIDKIFTDLWELRNLFLSKYGATYSNAASILLTKLDSATSDEIAEIVAGVMNWEGNLMSSQADVIMTDQNDVTEANIAEVKVFLHYDSNNSFLAENQLLLGIKKIEQIPTIIVHGRYDLLCTFDQMWALHKLMPKSEAVILPSSNHHFTADGDIARKYAYRYFLAKQSM